MISVCWLINKTFFSTPDQLTIIVSTQCISFICLLVHHVCVKYTLTKSYKKEYIVNLSFKVYVQINLKKSISLSKICNSVNIL